MVLCCSIIAASILLVLILTPAVVEGTNVCSEVCPNWVKYPSNASSRRNLFANGCNFSCDEQETESCWKNQRYCSEDGTGPLYGYCKAWCACNTFGYICDGCESEPGTCGWNDGGCEKFGGTLGPDEESGATTCFGARRRMEDEEKVDVCADFHSFRSLSAAGKRKAIANKYCVGEDHVVRDDIYKVLLNEVVKTLDGITLSEVVAKLGGIDNVLTCDLFNKAYIDVSHLTLCEDKHQHLAIVPASTKKSKKQKKRPKKLLTKRRTRGCLLLLNELL